MTVKLLIGQLEINQKVPTSQGSTHTHIDGARHVMLSEVGSVRQLMTTLILFQRSIFHHYTFAPCLLNCKERQSDQGRRVLPISTSCCCFTIKALQQRNRSVNVGCKWRLSHCEIVTQSLMNVCNIFITFLISCLCLKRRMICIRWLQTR